MCTTVLIGKKASGTGSTIIARNCDSEAPIQPVRYISVPANDHVEGTYHSNITGFEEEYPKEALAYQMIPFLDEKVLGIFGEAGINAKNVAMSSTESIFSNPQVLAIDPLTEQGIGEDSLLNMVLPYVTSAKDGVRYLGKLIAHYGSHEGNGVIFSDKDEVWYMEMPCGHHWVAQRVPDDCCAVIANQSIIEEVDFDDSDNFLYSEGIIEFVENNHLNPDFEGFNFRHIFGTSTKEDRRYNTARVWYGQNYFGHETKSPTESDMPFVFKPNRKLSVDDVAAVLSSHYDETKYDPFSPESDTDRKMFRPISMNRTAESHILEIRNHVPEEIAALLWLNSAPTAFNPYVPFYTNTLDTPLAYKVTTEDFNIQQAYWLSRTVAVLVERDYDVLSYTNFDYLTSAKTLAHHLVLETDLAFEKENPKDVQEFLLSQNRNNSDSMRQLAMKQINDLLQQCLGLSKLTFDITKDI
ncbi:C69 family dipeptidase [Enterococcus faecalis]|nr:C69 family dipeptidase [Enterococcus faecalis]